MFYEHISLAYLPAIRGVFVWSQVSHVGEVRVDFLGDFVGELFTGDWPTDPPPVQHVDLPRTVIGSRVPGKQQPARDRLLAARINHVIRTNETGEVPAERVMEVYPRMGFGIEENGPPLRSEAPAVAAVFVLGDHRPVSWELRDGA